MRALTLVAVAAFAPSAWAADPAPRPMPTPTPPGARANEPVERSVGFEVRIIKAPVGFSERLGLNTEASLSDEQLRRILGAAQEHRTTNVLQLPRLTVDDGQTAHVQQIEVRHFTTGIEAVSVKGETVLVPKNKPIELGDRLAISGNISADGQSVRVASAFTRVRIEGEVKLTPVTTQVAPVFEGGSQGKPVPFTQFLQAPDVRTEKAERAATVPTNGTIVLGSWKETEPTRGRAARYEVVVLGTVRVVR